MFGFGRSESLAAPGKLGGFSKSDAKALLPVFIAVVAIVAMLLVIWFKSL